MYLNFIEKSLDFIVSKWPQDKPTSEALKKAKIIAHRGAFGAKENTFAAFDPCLHTKIWGIEFDVRWTQDNIPVIHHDQHCGRVFNRPDIWINEVSFSKLRQEIPKIPSLEEVIGRYGKKLHLMIELKSSPTSYQLRTLRELLLESKEDLVAVDDFHLLSLNKNYFQNIDFIEPKCFLPVAELNLKEMSKAALENDWAGVAGHFFMVSNKVMAAHHQAGQKVGVGYVNSLPSLYRELNRGCTWLFSNKALELANALQ